MISTKSFLPASAGPQAPAGGQTPTVAPAELELGEVAVVIDQAGLIVAAEPICAALFQWEPSALVGQPLEVLLAAGADKIRQQLAPGRAAPAVDGESQPRLFALAQRKDGTSFPVGVTLQLVTPNAGCWWTVAFHDVNAAPVPQSELLEAGSLPPGAVPPSTRAQVASPLALGGIPDIFYRAPAEPEAQPDPPAPAAPEPPVLATRKEPAPESKAPAVPPAQPAKANGEARLHELEQRLNQSAADLKRTRAHLNQQDEQLHAANTAAQQATAALEHEAARRAQVEEQLTQACQLGDELNNRLAAEQQARAESEARLRELEQSLAQSAEELKRAQAQSPPPPVPAPVRAEDDPAVQAQLLDLEGRLRAAVTSLARATAELETERGERRRSEQRAATLAARMQQLHEELKDHLRSEQSDRQRLSQLEQELHDQKQQKERAAARLQSALQRSAEHKQAVQTLLESTLLLQTSLQESPES